MIIKTAKNNEERGGGIVGIVVRVAVRAMHVQLGIVQDGIITGVVTVATIYFIYTVYIVYILHIYYYYYYYYYYYTTTVYDLLKRKKK